MEVDDLRTSIFIIDPIIKAYIVHVNDITLNGIVVSGSGIITIIGLECRVRVVNSEVVFKLDDK